MLIVTYNILYIESALRTQGEKSLAIFQISVACDLFVFKSSFKAYVLNE